MQEVKPGVKWDEMHLLAERIIVQHLINLKIIKDAPLEELEKKTSWSFIFPSWTWPSIGTGHS